MDTNRPGSPLTFAVLVSFFLAALSLPAQQVDWADAPAPYPTTQAQNGARHAGSPGLFLGRNWDAENNGRPDPAALGDDKDNRDDEDGVVVPSSLFIGSTVNVFVLATNALGGLLNAWIDFNRDGDWADAGEQIVTDAAMVTGTNTFKITIPATAVMGETFARFRLSSMPGLSFSGPAPDGEVEDYRVSLMAPSVSGTNVTAHNANGQVWVVWNVEPAVLNNCVPTATPVLSNGVPTSIADCLPQTYAIYWSENPVTNTASAVLAGRLFAQEWSGAILRDNVKASFGAEPTGFRIPNGAGGYRVLGMNEGVFVHTVRSNFAGYYAVRPWGETNVPVEWRSGPVNAIFSPTDPPTCHLQASGTNQGYLVEWWTMWADGDTNLAAARPDFPIMENERRRGIPHNFSVTMPRSGLLPATPIPACIAFHSGDGQAKMWLPENNGFTSIGLAPVGELLIAVEDRFFSTKNGMVDAESITSTGYVPMFDPFFNHQISPVFASPPHMLPTTNDVIVPYPLYRLNWTLDWLYAHKNVDSNRVALVGHSGGSKGSLLWSHASPERFAAVGLYNPALGEFPVTDARYIGTREQNLPMLLTNHLGRLVRALDIHQFAASYSPRRDLPFTRIFLGKREENWVTDNNQDGRADPEVAYRQCDTLGLGAALFWDLRSHGMDTWTFVTLSNDIANPRKCFPNLTTNVSGAWSINDLWVPTLSTQYRRDDATNQIRHRADVSYPAFFNCALRGGHGDPGFVIYTNNSVFYDGFIDYDGLVTTTECRPPSTGDDRGTWGGYFDWETFVTDTPTNWAAVVFLVGPPSAFSNVEICPDPSRIVDVAIRRPQRFTPAPGALLNWELRRTDNNSLLQSGTTTVDSDGLVIVPNLTIFRDPQRARLEISLPAAPAVGKTVVITLNPDGFFSPARVEIFSGDIVEWHFANRADTIIPVNLNAAGQPDCINLKPYDPNDPNEFTGPMCRAASGIFTISPEELPYASEETTWRNPNISGVFIRPRWDDVNPAPGRFNWIEIDREIDQAVRNGKVFSIGFKAGVKGTPQWIFDSTKTDAVVTRLDFGFKQDGKPTWFGSPADPNYRKHYFDLLRAAAAHFRERNAAYRALAYIKPSGANLFTHENRLPNDTTQDLATWAGPGQYTPSALYEFYRQQEALLQAEFPEKDMDYALIQDGFPIINDFGEYLGQTNPPPQHPLPTGALQTETILNQGRRNFGQRFVVAHNGLKQKPAFCPGSGVHPITVSPGFSYVGSGCPNRWVLEQSELGQVTGFQTTNDLLTESDVDLALENAWDNSDAIYVELYERNAQQADAGVLPSGRTLAQWAELFHERRRAAFPDIPDPFPLTHVHRFRRSRVSGGFQELHFVNGRKCLSGDSMTYGTVVILADLSFTSITRDPDQAVRFTLNLARAGMLRVESSEDLVVWKEVQSQNAARGSVEFTDSSPPATARFYRAILE